MPTRVDEPKEPLVYSAMQSNQAVAKQEPEISAVSEGDVEMSEQNKEAMENAETFGFGYYKTFYPRVYVPSYPILPHYGYYPYPTYGNSLRYY